MICTASRQSASQQAMQAMGKNRVLRSCKIMHEKCFLLSSEVLLIEYLQNYAVLIDFH